MRGRPELDIHRAPALWPPDAGSPWNEIIPGLWMGGIECQGIPVKLHYLGLGDSDGLSLSPLPLHLEGCWRQALHHRRLNRLQGTATEP